MGVETIMMVGTAASAIGGVVSTISQMQAASYQAAVAERNAQLMDQNARTEIQRAQSETVDEAEAARAQIGQLVAAQSASGISMQTGSPLIRRRGAERLAQRDAVRIRSDANVQAENMMRQGADYRAEASMARSRRGATMLSGVLDVGSSIVGGARQIRGMRAQRSA